MSAFEKDMIDQYDWLVQQSDIDIDSIIRDNPDEFEALCQAWRECHPID